MDSLYAIVECYTMYHPNKWAMAGLQVNECFHCYPSFFYGRERRTSCMCIKLSTDFITSCAYILGQTPVPL